jgi:hypothetical protein
LPADAKEIMQIMDNMPGISNAIFPSDLNIHKAIQKMMAGYKEPLKKSASLVAKLLQSLIDKACRKLEDLPKLKETIRNLVYEQIQINQELAETHLTAYVDAESSFINTKHPDFEYGTSASIWLD